MARETRHSGKDATTEDAGHKRKRRPSNDPTSTPSIKLVIPSTSPNGTVNGDGGETSKRQKLSFKIGGKKTDSSPTKGELDVVQEKNDSVDGVEEKDDEEKKGTLLSGETREALSLVISRMAHHLPAPLSNILTLWLPPDFVQNEENTLGYVLNQPSLTWETLVDTLHVFSQNLLVPCAYPNPMPSLNQFHLPIPPLPSHLPPHVIYNFCDSLHSLMRNISPSSSDVSSVIDQVEKSKTIQRWALVQKTPASHGLPGGEWFTGAADLREAETLSKSIKKEQEEDNKSLMGTLAESGDKFGYASAVAIEPSHIASSSSKSQVPTLSESLIRRASLKMSKWKEMRAAKRAGGFGSVLKGVVTIPVLTGSTFTPSYAPMYDSSSSSGMGYHTTLEVMHQKRRSEEYNTRAWSKDVDKEEGSWQGSVDAEEEVNLADADKVANGVSKGKGKERDIEHMLEDNEDLIEELRAWQYLRLRRGQETWLPDRERLVAEELLVNLTRIAENTKPSDLLPSSSISGTAHDLAKRFIPVSSVAVRGTLDAKRPNAIHDSTTVRIRSNPGNVNGSGQLSSGLGFPPPTPQPMNPGYSNQAYPRTNTASAPSPRTPYYPQTSSQSHTYRGPSQGYPYSPGIPGNYRNDTPGLAGYRSSAPIGPSGLRQAHGTPASAGSYGNDR